MITIDEVVGLYEREGAAWYGGERRAGYRAGLSEESKRSLEFQGGTFDARQAGEFLRRPFAADAPKLRIWDDLAKVPGAATPSLRDIAKTSGRGGELSQNCNRRRIKCGASCQSESIRGEN